MVTETHHKPIGAASLLTALSAILYGFLGYLGISLVQHHLSINDMQFWRFFVASLWLAGFAAWDCRRTAIANVSGRSLGALFLLGAIVYAGSSEFYFIACQAIGTGLAMVVFFSYPVMIALSSWLFGNQGMQATTLVILAIMMAGLLCLHGTSVQSLSLTGIAFSVVAAACYAFYVVLSKQFSVTSIPSSLLSFVVCLGCACSFLVLSLHTGHIDLPATLQDGLYVVLLGVLATALPIQLMLVGLKYISSMRASIISVLEPLVTVVVGALLLNENFSLLQVFGGVLILGSALLIQFQKEL